VSLLAVASFSDEGAFRDAVLRAGVDGRRVAGCWSPYPVEGLPANAGPRGIVAAVIAAGLLSAAGLFALQMWSATVAYPFNEGSRPLASWQAFLIAPIEFGALAAAVAGLVALIVRARLTRLSDPAFDLQELGRASRDRFVLALACADGDEAESVAAGLSGAGATEARVVAP
jgi:hypothetical protein